MCGRTIYHAKTYKKRGKNSKALCGMDLAESVEDVS